MPGGTMHLRFSIFDFRFCLAVQSQIANHKSKTSCSAFLCVLCGVLFLLLAGCKTEEAARAEAPRVATVSTAELQPADRRPPPAPVPPLRRTAASPQEPGAPELPGGDGPQDLSALTVSAVPQENGAMRLRLALAPPHGSSALAEELEKLGFEPEPPARTGANFRTRAVAAEERAAFEKLVLARIEETARRLGHLQSLEMRARQPGRIVWLGPEEPGKFLSGKLAYTGHPMDIALADAGNSPHLFLAVESQTAGANPAAEYVRGGRLFVAEDWTVGLDEFKPAGEWKKVPFETERISVRPDGQVLAFLHDGTSQGLGLLRVVRLAAFKPAARVNAKMSSIWSCGLWPSR